MGIRVAFLSRGIGIEPMKLREILESYTVDTLKPLAAFCGGSSITRKAELVEYITRAMTSPEGLRQQWEQLDELSRKAVSLAVHNGGHFDQAVFLARYGRLPPRPSSRWSWERKPIRLDLFLYNGHIPDDLLPLLETWVPRPEPFRIEGRAEAPTKIRQGESELELLRAETEHTGPQDLAAFLRLVERGEATVSAHHLMPTAVTVKKLLPLLHEGDFWTHEETPRAAETIRPVGLTLFATQGGLARQVHSYSDKLELTDAGRAWLNTQDPELLLQAFERWTQSDLFDELSRIRAIRGRNARGTRLTPPSSRRERIVEALSWCPEGVWIDVEDFFRAIIAWQLDFEVEVGERRGLYVGYASYAPYYEVWGDAEAYWRIIHGLYILVVLWETLATIGALDIAYLLPEDAEYYAEVYYYDEPYYSLYDGLKFFRINPLGAYLFGQRADYTPFVHARPPFLQALVAPAAGPNALILRITAAEQVTPADRLMLATVATPLDDDRYRIDMGSLLTALEQEHDLEAVLAYIQEWHHGPVPDELTSLFREAIARRQAFGAPEAALTIHVQDPRLAKMVVEDAKLKRFCRLAGDRLIVIPANRERAFRNRLRELGYILPKS